MILLAVSHTPIGLTPGHLSNAISRQPRNADRPLGSTNDVQSLLASKASEWHSSRDAEWKEVHRHLQQCASSPEAPAVPLVLRAGQSGSSLHLSYHR